MQTSIFGDLLLLELWEWPWRVKPSWGGLPLVPGGMDSIISEALLGSWRLGGPLDSFYCSQPQAWPGFPSRGQREGTTGLD